MNERGTYDFCPRCGAVMQDGVCKSCGYGKKAGRADRSQDDPKKAGPKRSKGGKLVLALILAGASLLVLTVVLYLVFTVGKVVGSLEPDYTGGFDGYYDYYDGYGGYGGALGEGGAYVPSPSDDYYVEITDAVPEDPPFEVHWKTVSLHPDQEEDSCTYYCVFPVLAGEEKKFQAVNQAIQELACAYQDSYREYTGGVSSYGYVTYMDEEKVSVAVQHTLYDDGMGLPEVRAVNFRMDTGEVIPYGELAQADLELVKQFRSRNASQNGEVEFVENASDEELMEYLQDEEKTIMFYTPVGLELGFNYDEGWVTVTLKSSIL